MMLTYCFPESKYKRRALPIVSHDGAGPSALVLVQSDCGSSCAGLADPVYAEAYVTVHQYDIVLDVTVINRTSETLQNLCLELATMGDLKLVERPQNYTLSPQSSKTIRCSLGSAVGMRSPASQADDGGACRCYRTSRR